jgi:hypothetical protein
MTAFDNTTNNDGRPCHSRHQVDSAAAASGILANISLYSPSSVRRWGCCMLLMGIRKRQRISRKETATPVFQGRRLASVRWNDRCQPCASVIVVLYGYSVWTVERRTVYTLTDFRVFTDNFSIRYITSVHSVICLCSDKDQSKVDELMLSCIRNGDSSVLQCIGETMLGRRKLIDWKVRMMPATFDTYTRFAHQFN